MVTAAAEALGGGVDGFAVGRLGNGGHLHRYRRYLHLDERDLRLGRYLFERFGGRVVFVARFIGFLRPRAGLLARANEMVRAGMPMRRGLERIKNSNSDRGAASQ